MDTKVEKTIWIQSPLCMVKLLIRAGRVVRVRAFQGFCSSLTSFVLYKTRQACCTKEDILPLVVPSMRILHGWNLFGCYSPSFCSNQRNKTSKRVWNLSTWKSRMWHPQIRKHTQMMGLIDDSPSSNSYSQQTQMKETGSYLNGLQITYYLLTLDI